MPKIRLDDEMDALTLRWLQRAVSKNHSWRKNITGIKVGKTEAIATDGYRIHKGPIPTPLKEFSGEKVGIRVNQGRLVYKSVDREYPISRLNTDFPETEHIFPTQPPKTVMAINRNFLKEALEIPIGKNGHPGVILEFYPKGDYDHLVVSTGDGSYKAVIMGMGLTSIGYKKSPEEKSVKKAYKALDILRERYPNIHTEVINAA